MSQQIGLKSHDYHPYPGQDGHTTDSTQSQPSPIATAQTCSSLSLNANQAHSTRTPLLIVLLGTPVTGFEGGTSESQATWVQALPLQSRLADLTLPAVPLPSWTHK